MHELQKCRKSASLSRLNRCLIIAVILVAAAHFLVVNDLSTKGFVFKDLKARVNQLIADNQDRQNQVSSLGSYQSINPRIASLHLVAADTIHYLSWDQAMVARK
jgi:hypothetical protein